MCFKFRGNPKPNTADPKNGGPRYTFHTSVFATDKGYDAPHDFLVATSAVEVCGSSCAI